MKNEGFFNKVRDSLEEYDDLEPLAEAVSKASAHYEEVCEEFRANHSTISGELNRLILETPGLQLYYGSVFIDAQQVRKWLEQVDENVSSKLYTWFLSDDGRAEYGKISTTDINNYVKANEDVQLVRDMIRLISYSQHQLEEIVGVIQQRGYTLQKIADMRIKGLEEVWVEPPKKA